MGTANRLTATFVRQVKQPGVYRDGAGLILRVSSSGSRRWVFRCMPTGTGKIRDVGVGSANDVSLAEARDKASVLRKIAREGGDPVIANRKATSGVPTFSTAAEKVHALNEPSWKNSKHAAQWINTLRTYVNPKIGDVSVADLTAAHVLDCLSPIWLSKPETARRTRQRIRTVLDWAAAAGFRPQNEINPADAVVQGLPKQSRNRKHHRAIPWKELPDLMALVRLQPSAQSVLLAFEFLVLTAARSGEVRGMAWEEIDFSEKLWTVPGSRMKAGRPHRVPLSTRAISVLNQAKTSKNGGEALVFPGRGVGKPLSDMSLAMLLRRTGRSETPHGMRSSFRDWAADNGWSGELGERALAHVVKDETEAAYFRTDMLELRRPMMDAWADFAGEMK